MDDSEKGSVLLSAAAEDDGFSNILLLVPPFHPADLDGCMDLLTIMDPARENVWSLGITLSPNDRVENWERRVGEKPAAFRIITVTELPQMEAEKIANSYGFDPEPHFVTIPDAGDLTRIGVELTKALDDWASFDRQTVVCFHSVSALLQYTNVERAFQFLNTFTSQIEQGAAVAHYHMNPEAHEESTVAKVTPLFDAVVEIDPEDDWNITTR